MIKITQLKLDINHSEKDLENRIRKLLKLKPDTTFTYEISKKEATVVLCIHNFS